MTKRKKMRRLVVIAAALIVTATAGVAQSPIPDLKGTWKGTGKILLFGTTEHLTGSPQNASCATSRSRIQSPVRTAR